ncbi:MAG: hypothetical protein WB721_09655 [Pseudolabrys sp.]
MSHFKNAELASHIIGKDADFAYGASKLVRRDAEFLRPEAKLVVVMDVDTFPLTDTLGLVVEHAMSEPCRMRSTRPPLLQGP